MCNQLDLVLPKFQLEYVMYESVTTDEVTIPFKGRLSFKQYIKNKPNKRGIKAFVLSDATNRYVYRSTGLLMSSTSSSVLFVTKRGQNRRFHLHSFDTGQESSIPTAMYTTDKDQHRFFFFKV